MKLKAVVSVASGVEVLADGRVLAVSDYEDRNSYLASVCGERSPPLAANRAVLNHQSESRGG